MSLVKFSSNVKKQMKSTFLFALNDIYRHESLLPISIRSIQEEKKLEFYFKMQMCVVCCDEKPVKKFEKKYSRRCRHAQRTIFDDCIYGNVQDDMRKMCTDQVRCPETSCEIQFSYRAVQRVLTCTRMRNGTIERR